MKDLAEKKKWNIPFLVASSFTDVLYEKSHKIGSLKLYDGESIQNILAFPVAFLFLFP